MPITMHTVILTTTLSIMNTITLMTIQITTNTATLTTIQTITNIITRMIIATTIHTALAVVATMLMFLKLISLCGKRSPLFYPWASVIAPVR